MTTFKEQLEKDGILVYRSKGISMFPLIRENKDVIIIETPKAPFKKYDAVLFVRSNGQYVLHRILKVLDDNTFYIVGDNCISGEKVDKSQIIGILTSIRRGKKGKEINSNSLNYKLYAHIWCDFYHIRVFLLKVRNKWRKL